MSATLGRARGVIVPSEGDDINDSELAALSLVAAAELSSRTVTEDPNPASAASALASVAIAGVSVTSGASSTSPRPALRLAVDLSDTVLQRATTLWDGLQNGDID